MSEASTVTFVEQLSFHSVDACDDKCFDKRKTHINTQSVIFTRVK